MERPGSRSSSDIVWDCIRTRSELGDVVGEHRLLIDHLPLIRSDQRAIGDILVDPAPGTEQRAVADLDRADHDALREDRDVVTDLRADPAILRRAERTRAD